MPSSPQAISLGLSFVAIVVYHVATADDITFGLLEPLLPRITAIPTSATQPCPAGSQNCVRTTWTAPVETTKETAVAQIKAVFNAYPQKGLADKKIDLGGWKVADGSLDEGKFRIEYSSGKGFFARLFNGGKPFIDDVLVEIVASSSSPVIAEIRSSSRLGKSDLGVNPKRISYLAKQIRQQGWDAPKPTYPQ